MGLPVMDRLPPMLYLVNLLFLAVLGTTKDAKGTRLKSSIAVVNTCDHPVIIWSVGDKPAIPATIPALYGIWTEECYRKADGSGISIKISDMATVNAGTSLIQLEYTTSHN